MSLKKLRDMKCVINLVNIFTTFRESRDNFYNFITQSEIFLGLMRDNGRIRVASPLQSSVALWGGYVAFGDDNQGGHLGGAILKCLTYVGGKPPIIFCGIMGGICRIWRQ